MRNEGLPAGWMRFRMQLSLKRTPSPTESSSLCLGLPAEACQPALQSDAFKELVNKLAWALGSTYGTPYNNTRTQARVTAIEVATAVILAHGYPKTIGYPK